MNKDIPISKLYINNKLEYDLKAKENKEWYDKKIKEDYKESYRKEIDYWRIQYSNLQDRIDKAIGYTNELIDDTKGMLNNMEYQDKEETITRYVEDLEKDIKNYEYQISILRGEDNE